MPLTEIALQDSYLTPFYGRELYFSLEGFSRLDLYSLIINDLTPYWSFPSRAGALVEWNVLVNVLEYNPEIVQVYGGTPKRSRFGGYNYVNADMNGEHNFIYFEKQYLPYGRTFVVPGQEPETLIFPPVLAPLTANRLRGQTDLNSTRALPTATAVNIDLNKSVIADIYICYVGQIYDGDTFNYYNETVFINV